MGRRLGGSAAHPHEAEGNGRKVHSALVGIHAGCKPDLQGCQAGCACLWRIVRQPGCAEHHHRPGGSFSNQIDHIGSGDFRAEHHL